MLYNDELLFAPDVMYKDGTYFMYNCQPDRGGAEGVATSKGPTEPFTNGKKMNVAGIEEIDPCVFMDDGTINEVEMTTQGAESVEGKQTLWLVFGGVRICSMWIG